MRHKALSITLFIFCFSSLLSAQSSVQYVKPGQENIRIAANGAKCGNLTSGTEVSVLEKKGNWTKISVTAWIWNGSLTSDPTAVEGYTVTAAHILLASKEDAQNVLDKLNKGADFDELAKLYSIDERTKDVGGLLGEFGRGDLMEAFEKALFSLKQGETSEIVHTKLGYHIIKRVK